MTAARAGEAPADLSAASTVDDARYVRTTQYLLPTDSAVLPLDMANPDSRTRWLLDEGLAGGSVTVQVRRTDDAVFVKTTVPGPDGTRVSSNRRYAPASPGGDDAVDWLLPEKSESLLRPGESRVYELTATEGDRTESLRVTSRGIAAGWAELPSRPYEVAVERSIVEVRDAGSGELAKSEEVVRWIAADVGVVAETRTPVEGAGGAMVLGETDDAANLKIFDDELGTLGIRTDVAYGWNRGAVNVSTVEATAPATVADLIALDTWDFSGNTSANRVGIVTSTNVPLDENNTCNIDLDGDGTVQAEDWSCGFDPTLPGNRVLARQDNDFDDTAQQLEITNTIFEREEIDSNMDGTIDEVIVWQRGGVQKEGIAGAFGAGESRFCYDPTDGISTPVAQWEFTNPDPEGFFIQAGDNWSTTLACEITVWGGGVCGGGLGQWTGACTDGSTGTHTGTQSTEVLKGGVVMTASGHTLNTLLFRIVTDFCVFTAPGCLSLFKTDTVRKPVYLWVAPVLGTVARVQGTNVELDVANFSVLEETDFKYGLFPPRTISSTGNTDTTVDLQWDPGLETSHINGYKVRWGTASGVYDFDSSTNAAQVTFDGTSATITGLTAGTTYYFTVTSLSSHTDSISGVTTDYESLVFPTQVFGDPSFAYPTEVMVATSGGGSCTPTEELQNLTVQKVGGGMIEFCWTQPPDPCRVGTDLWGSVDKTTDTAYSIVTQVDDPQTCWTGNPSDIYYVVAGRGGSGEEGPWGAYGR